MTDNLVERLRARAESYRQSGPSAEHTAELLDEAATALGAGEPVAWRTFANGTSWMYLTGDKATVEPMLKENGWIYDALFVAPPAPAVTEGDDEIAWLAEHKTTPIEYACLTEDYDEHFTTDPNRALRFARKEDAQAFIDHHGWTVVFPVEHMWCVPRKHVWIERHGLTCCQNCGNVRNDTSDTRACKGIVRVDLRAALSAPPAPGVDAGTVEMMLAALKQVDAEMRAGLGPSSGETREQVRRAIRAGEAAIRALLPKDESK